MQEATTRMQLESQTVHINPNSDQEVNISDDDMHDSEPSGQDELIPNPKTPQTSRHIRTSPVPDNKRPNRTPQPSRRAKANSRRPQKSIQNPTDLQIAKGHCTKKPVNTSLNHPQNYEANSSPPPAAIAAAEAGLRTPDPNLGFQQAEG